MSAKLYLLRDESQPQHMYFKSISDDGCGVEYSVGPASAHRSTKEQLSNFRKAYSHVKGSTVLFSREVERRVYR